MFIRIKKNTGLLSVSALALMISSGASAQDPLNEIIVTATKIQKNVQDLGLSVSVVDGEGLSKFDSAEELSQHVAGLQAAVANGNQIAFQIRGIGAVDHQALTPTAAAVYVDGVFQATNVQTGPLLFDLERAEVLKGPQGSLYGRNATAGAINFISARPSDTHEGFASLELGTFERVNLNAAATIPVSDDFSFRLSGRYLSQGPQIDNVVTDEAVEAPEEAGGVRDEFGLRAIGLYTPSDQTNILINLHYAEDNGINASPRNEGLDLGNHEISVGPTGVQDTDNEFYGASVEITHDFGSFDVVSLTAFEGYNQQYGFDFAALPSFFGGQNANLSYDRDFSQFSQELRLHREGERYESLVGLYLETEDFEQDYLLWCGELNLTTLVGSCDYIVANSRVGTEDRRFVEDVNGDPVLVDVVDENGIVTGTEQVPINASTLQSLIQQERRTAALFTHNTYQLTPKFELVVGARLTYETIEGSGEGRHIFSDGVVGLNNQNDLGPAEGENEINETRLTGNLGLNYKFSDDALFYASYANGYKSGGFNGEVINNATHFDDAGLFGSETVDTFELGAKFSGPSYRFNIAAFYNDYSDPQARFFDNVTLENGQSVSLNSLSNFAGATSQGIDIDGEFQPLEALRLYGGLTLQSSDIQDTELTFNDEAYLDGDDLPFASETSLVLGVNYTQPITDSASLNVDVSTKYQSEFATGLDGVAGGSVVSAFVQDGYELIDASAQLDFDRGISLGIWGRNLSNSDYAVSSFRFFGDTTFRGAPRTYGVSLKYSY